MPYKTATAVDQISRNDITNAHNTTAKAKHLHNKNKLNSMMTMNRRKNDAVEALEKLAGGMDGKSETAKIREVIDSVELALSSGVRRENVFNALRESLGIKMNFRTFETTLHRIRKKIKSENKMIIKNHELNFDSDNIIENNFIISEESNSTLKKYLNDENDNTTVNSKRYFTPKRLREIREQSLQKLDNNSSVNYD